MDTSKLRLFEQFAELARALGNANRLELLEHLAQGERAVEVLAERTGLSLANVSQHLQLLRRSGFVTSRRSGRLVLYRLADGPIIEVLGSIRKLAEHHLAGVREIMAGYFGKLDNLEAISREELMCRLQEGNVTLLDVRPREEFDLGHLPGALNMPLSDIQRRLAELPENQEIIAYCRGPYCILAFEAVSSLRSKGYRARRLEEGFPEWKAAGLTVEMV